MDIPEKVLEAVRGAAVEGRLTCVQAQKIGDDLGVPYPIIGEAANLLDIKICSCQLGCF